MSTYPPSGVLFQNDRKQRDTHPDYNGNLEVSREIVDDLVAQVREGIDKPVIDLAGWRKMTKAGKPFLSLRGGVPWKRKKTDEAQQRAYQNAAPSNDFDLGGDDIPFDLARAA